MAKISMASLAAKYNDFMVPAMKVKAGGFDLIGASEYGENWGFRFFLSLCGFLQSTEQTATTLEFIGSTESISERFQLFFMSQKVWLLLEQVFLKLPLEKHKKNTLKF